MDDPTTPSEGRRRWSPQRITITAHDAPRERVEAAAPEGGTPQQLLGTANQLQQVVASLAVRRALLQRGVEVSVRMHRFGVAFLRTRDGDAERLGYVIPFVSSMEPRPIWPTLIPLAVLNLVPIEWIGSCSVPKQPALDAIEDHDSFGYLLGWLDADEVAQLPIVTVAPHLGHEYEAKYRPAKHHRLTSFDDWDART